MTPQQIGRYEILKLLGRGAMGEVYRAYDPQLNRKVALKLITPPDSASSNEWRRRFQREVQTAAQLNHPHIVTVYDVDLDYEPPYVVMELLTGDTLTEYLQQKPLPWQEILTLLHPLGQALAYAHQAGIIHRDVKPANVMFTGDRILKLVDFGLARWQGGEQVTQTGVLVGTPVYMSPEQARGEIVDARTDIFSLGIILLEMITGHNPLDQGSVTSTIAELCSDTPVDLTLLNEKVPQTVTRLITRAVAKHREQRYATTEALLTDLVSSLDDQATVSIVPPQASKPSAGLTIHTRDQTRLPPEVETVLRTMFSDYGWLEIEAEFGCGLGGCRVFRVRPVETRDKVHLPLAVKIGPISLIHQEWQAYQTWVKDTLPEIARLESPPTFPSGSLWGGLRYTLVGSGTFAVESLHDYYFQANSGDLTWVLKNRLFKIMGDNWWRFHRAARLRLQAEYDALLPVNLLIRPTDSSPADDSISIEPGHLPSSHIIDKGHVHLRGFVVTEIDDDHNQVTLNVPPRPTTGQLSDSYRLRLMDVPDIDRYQVGQVVDSLHGIIEASRHNLLIEQTRHVMGQTFDLSAEQLTLSTGQTTLPSVSLPNPLLAYPKILNTFLTVHTSTIHGDLNLENVLVDPDTRQPSLIDFATVCQGHVLHDLLHLETAIVTKLIPPTLAETGLEPETIYVLYQQLHNATFHPDRFASLKPLHPSLEKPLAMLGAIREMACECLFSTADWTEYYFGLSLYLLGALKFEDLDELPEAPRPKQVAFWGAATSIHLQEKSQGDEPMPQSTQFFISYKQQTDSDRELATYLHQFLTTQGHAVFIDRTLRTGDDWLEQIDQQIKTSDFLIVLLSKESANSEMVQAEIRRAYEYRKLQGKPHALPVRMAYEELLPYSIDFFLDPLQYVLWQNEADNERVGHDILAAIEGRLPPQVPIKTKPMSEGLIISEDGRPTINEETLPPPLPQFDPRFLEALEAPGQVIKLRDKFYIERGADARLKQLMLSGTAIAIRAPRQTGKTSLLMRGLHYAYEQGAKVISLDFQGFGHDSLASPDIFLYELAGLICHELRLDETSLEKAWHGSQRPEKKLTYFLEDYVLRESDAPVILAMDEADYLLQTSFYQDFFGLIRLWHNRRASHARYGWDRLNIVLVIATEPYLIIADAHRSPFNVGYTLELEDFNETQVRDLNQRHDSPVQEYNFGDFIKLLNGHPYLTRQALYILATEKVSWTDLTRMATADQGPFGDHLRRYHWLLRNEPDLKAALKQVIQLGRCDDQMARFRLLRAGLVKGSGEVYTCRCDLYRLYFQDKL
ncbi:MAG: AAA-like domain-containing protein [Anaerolineae bacterium]|nr:AAA-like domain-containing protein [Anaerolineae bacterium]